MSLSLSTECSNLCGGESWERARKCLSQPFPPLLGSTCWNPSPFPHLLGITDENSKLFYPVLAYLWTQYRKERVEGCLWLWTKPCLPAQKWFMGSPRTLQHQLRHVELDMLLWQSYVLKYAMGSQPMANKAIRSTKETRSSFHLGENAAKARSETPRTANYKEQPGWGCRGNSWKVCRREQT